MFNLETRKNIFILNFDTQYDLCSTFIRLQEFCESPYSEICGHYFTLEDYMDIYAKNNKNKFTYFEDWNGFNITSKQLKVFLEFFDGKLSKKEQIFQFFNHVVKLDQFSILATHKKSYNSVIKHELAHAYFFLYRDYNDKIYEMISNMNLEKKKYLEKKIREIGYANNTIFDEMQAYLSTNTSEAYWKKHFGTDFDFTEELKKFSNHFNEFNKRIK